MEATGLVLVEALASVDELLLLPHVSIDAALNGGQLLVGALLHNLALLHNNNHIRVLDGREAVMWWEGKM